MPAEPPHPCGGRLRIHFQPPLCHNVQNYAAFFRFDRGGVDNAARRQDTVAFSVSTWDTYSMNTESRHLLQSALALPESDRAEIAASLIHSLDTGSDEDVDEAWAMEIQRRIESIDNGEVRLVPWDDVMREMRDRRHG